MWIPESFVEVVEALDVLEESSTLDFKRELGGKSAEIAKDITAMTAGGGVLVYGVDECDDGTFQPMPILLKGEAERVDQISRALIHEPPSIQIKALRDPDDAERGFLVVVVPVSDRAPHMVEVKNEYCYYGRGATGNRRLTEAEVARFYDLRRQNERDDSVLFEELVSATPRPFDQSTKKGFLYLIASPLHADETAFESSLSKDSDFVYKALQSASSKEAWDESHPYPSFSVVSGERTPSGVVCHMMPLPKNPDEERERLDLEFLYNGTMRLFCSRATDTHPSGNTEVAFEFGIVDWVVRFLFAAGLWYQHSSSYGAIRLGILVNGVEDTISSWLLGRKFHYPVDPAPFPEPEYRRLIRRPAFDLVNQHHGVAKQLLGRLLLATTQGYYNPFGKDPEGSSQ